MQFKQIPRKTAPLYIIENTFKGIKYKNLKFNTFLMVAICFGLYFPSNKIETSIISFKCEEYFILIFK